MRTLAVALEVYVVDHNNYPVAYDYFFGGGLNPLVRRFIPLTTPVAYIATIPEDPFVAKNGVWFPTPTAKETVNTFDYWDIVTAETMLGADQEDCSLFGREWRMSSAGPDLYYAWADRPYDPTNGTVSKGDIILLQGGGNGWEYALAKGWW